MSHRAGLFTSVDLHTALTPVTNRTYQCQWESRDKYLRHSSGRNQTRYGRVQIGVDHQHRCCIRVTPSSSEHQTQDDHYQNNNILTWLLEGPLVMLTAIASTRLTNEGHEQPTTALLIRGSDLKMYKESHTHTSLSSSRARRRSHRRPAPHLRIITISARELTELQRAVQALVNASGGPGGRCTFVDFTPTLTRARTRTRSDSQYTHRFSRDTSSQFVFSSASVASDSQSATSTRSRRSTMSWLQKRSANLFRQTSAKSVSHSESQSEPGGAVRARLLQRVSSRLSSMRGTNRDEISSHNIPHTSKTNIPTFTCCLSVAAATRIVMQTCRFMRTVHDKNPDTSAGVSIFEYRFEDLSSEIDNLQQTYECEVEPDLSRVDLRVVAGTLLVALQKLNNPLITSSSFYQFQSTLHAVQRAQTQQGSLNNNHGYMNSAQAGNDSELPMHLIGTVEDMAHALAPSKRRILREWSHTVATLRTCSNRSAALDRIVSVFTPVIVEGCEKPNDACVLRDVHVLFDVLCAPQHHQRIFDKSSSAAKLATTIYAASNPILNRQFASTHLSSVKQVLGLEESDTDCANSGEVTSAKSENVLSLDKRRRSKLDRNANGAGSIGGCIDEFGRMALQMDIPTKHTDEGWATSSCEGAGEEEEKERLDPLDFVACHSYAAEHPSPELRPISKMVTMMEHQHPHEQEQHPQQQQQQQQQQRKQQYEQTEQRQHSLQQRSILELDDLSTWMEDVDALNKSISQRLRSDPDSAFLLDPQQLNRAQQTNASEQNTKHDSDINVPNRLHHEDILDVLPNDVHTNKVVDAKNGDENLNVLQPLENGDRTIGSRTGVVDGASDIDIPPIPGTQPARIYDSLQDLKPDTYKHRFRNGNQYKILLEPGPLRYSKTLEKGTSGTESNALSTLNRNEEYDAAPGDNYANQLFSLWQNVKQQSAETILKHDFSSIAKTDQHERKQHCNSSTPIVDPLTRALEQSNRRLTCTLAHVKSLSPPQTHMSRQDIGNKQNAMLLDTLSEVIENNINQKLLINAFMRETVERTRQKLERFNREFGWNE